VAPTDCAAKPVTDSCLKYYNTLFQFISVYKEILLCIPIWRINIFQGFETETKRKMSKKKAENKMGTAGLERCHVEGRKNMEEI
jgi:hypothetical protein